MTGIKQYVASEFNKIKQLELCALERSVVQVEAVNVNSGLHSRPWIKKARAAPKKQPLNRQHAAGGYLCVFSAKSVY